LTQVVEAMLIGGVVMALPVFFMMKKELMNDNKV